MLALLLLSVIPHDPVPPDHVAAIEHNHFYDDDGQHVFDQLIFWEWRADQCAMRVRAWRMVKGDWRAKRDWQRGGWSVIWPENETLREVRADSYRETWEQYDPELVDREFLPKEKRAGLKGERPWPTTDSAP
jgi:hypothetical protein